LALATSAATIYKITTNMLLFAATFDAGDQFGAVTVCDNVPAFVGGFRENDAARLNADLLKINLASRTTAAPP
jgi:hypothetical protein